jgi:ribose transport system substrate-binding protein
LKKHRALIAALLAFAAVGVTMAVSATAAPAKTTKAAANCGDIPNKAPNDPSSLLPGLKLSKAQQHDYTGWNHPIVKSNWANWKPKGSGPYKVAVVWSQPGNGFNAYAFNLVQKYLKRSSIIDKSLIVSAASSPTAIADQLQQYNAAVQQHPDLIIFAPLAPPAATASIDAAAKQGIPTVSVYNDPGTANAVTIAANPYVEGTEVASSVVKALNGQGNIFEMLGSPSAGTTVDTQAAWKTVFNGCPNINVVGQAYGFFSTALAKVMTLQFLTTHTQKVDAAIETGAMAQGVLQGFQQAGRPVPPIGQTQAAKSVTAYWNQNASKGYPFTAVVAGAQQFASLIDTVSLRMLAGQGPKINFVPWRYLQFSGKQMKKYVNPNWTTDTPGSVELAPIYWWKKADYDRLFNHPDRTKGTSF